jgi:hypothetical protein
MLNKGFRMVARVSVEVEALSYKPEGRVFET